VGQLFHILGDSVTIQIDTLKQHFAPVLQKPTHMFNNFYLGIQCQSLQVIYINLAITNKITKTEDKYKMDYKNPKQEQYDVKQIKESRFEHKINSSITAKYDNAAFELILISDCTNHLSRKLIRSSQSVTNHLYD
jgi:hypothetical protein